ncbi:hypothetical protein NQ317_001047 [Molorchus minor]|uniref:Uncharacterized protein n=1 Tax=Molorchus minor TaxID=1323400 RepID=A0ABQ9JQI6_9CUCU|nr:hypothetical protein NQ317_001047 [Molorchus minor]
MWFVVRRTGFTVRCLAILENTFNVTNHFSRLDVLFVSLWRLKTTDRNDPGFLLKNIDYNIAINKKLRLVSRLQWLAQPPIEQPDPLKTPVALVIVQHTATEPCYSLAQCIFHSNHWWDIGYNFLVGGDGAAYEGRGWTQEGSHTFGYNNKSIGVGFIGTFTAQKPPLAQIVAFNKLIEKGVELNYIQKDYKILAARQLYGTESPGTAFFNEQLVGLENDHNFNFDNVPTNIKIRTVLNYPPDEVGQPKN